MVGIVQAMLMAGVQAKVDATVAMSPPGISTTKANATAFNQSFTANVSNGVGTFTYAWSWQSGGTGLTISNATSQTCTVAGTGTNVEKFGTLQVIVTDTGNGNKTCSDAQLVDVSWGTPL